jgi:hypothetical protein
MSLALVRVTRTTQSAPKNNGTRKVLLTAAMMNNLGSPSHASLLLFIFLPRSSKIKGFSLRIEELLKILARKLRRKGTPPFYKVSLTLLRFRVYTIISASFMTAHEDFNDRIKLNVVAGITLLGSIQLSSSNCAE